MDVSEHSISVTSSGRNLKAKLFVPRQDTRVPALIICHGAFEYKERYLEMGSHMARSGIAALIPDMNGHGESEGKRYHVIIERWVEDIRACIDYMEKRDEIDSWRIASFGLSTGGTAVIETSLVDSRVRAMILYAATVRNVMTVLDMITYCMVLPFGVCFKICTGEPLKIPMPRLVMGRKLTYDEDAHRRILDDPMFQTSYVPVPGALQASWVNTIKRSSQIAVPTLVMHGEEDTLDKPESSRLLFKRIPSVKRLVILPRMGHVATMDLYREKMYELTEKWIHEHLSAPDAPCQS